MQRGSQAGPERKSSELISCYNDVVKSTAWKRLVCFGAAMDRLDFRGGIFFLLDGVLHDNMIIKDISDVEESHWRIFFESVDRFAVFKERILKPVLELFQIFVDVCKEQGVSQQGTELGKTAKRIFDTSATALNWFGDLWLVEISDTQGSHGTLYQVISEKIVGRGAVRSDEKTSAADNKDQPALQAELDDPERFFDSWFEKFKRPKKPASIPSPAAAQGVSAPSAEALGSKPLNVREGNWISKDSAKTFNRIAEEFRRYSVALQAILATLPRV